ncbi:hypothetical protein [Miltoncostaea oceani]|nr:hypothetical protein [Miltoncostaea oceani]
MGGVADLLSAPGEDPVAGAPLERGVHRALVVVCRELDVVGRLADTA